MLVEYVANTHAVTHDMYTLEVMEVQYDDVNQSLSIADIQYL